MANVRSGNTFYIDTQYSAATDELATKNLRVLGVILTTTAAGGNLVLSDNGVTKLNFKNATDEDTKYFDLSKSPVIFANSIRPTTLSGAVATVILQESSG